MKNGRGQTDVGFSELYSVAVPDGFSPGRAIVSINHLRSNGNLPAGCGYRLSISFIDSAAQLVLSTKRHSVREVKE